MTMMMNKSVSHRRSHHPRVHGMASLLIHMQLLALMASNFARSFSSSSDYQAVRLFLPRRPAMASSNTCRFMDTAFLFQHGEHGDGDGNRETKRTNKHYEAGLPLATSNSRRQTLQTMMVMTSLPLLLFGPPPANAAAAATDTTTTTTDVKPSIVPAVEVLQRLRKVPVYAIVDGLGIPFMTYDSESAGANGYFFLDYMNAQGVLEDAKRAYATAKEKQVEGVSDTWGDSRIVTLPLDLAMRLTVKQVSNVAQNDKSFRTIYQVLPSAVRTCTRTHFFVMFKYE
jgi:Tic22-like family